MTYDPRRTSEVIPSLYNGKPYRTKEQKALARQSAVKTHKGYWVSYAPKSRHPQRKELEGNKP